MQIHLRRGHFQRGLSSNTDIQDRVSVELRIPRQDHDMGYTTSLRALPLRENDSHAFFVAKDKIRLSSVDKEELLVMCSDNFHSLFMLGEPRNVMLDYYRVNRIHGRHLHLEPRQHSNNSSTVSSLVSARDEIHQLHGSVGSPSSHSYRGSDWYQNAIE